MLVKCRDRSLVKLYIEGRIDKSELVPEYTGYWGYPYYGWYGPYGHPYWHDYHHWGHWSGWAYNRRYYHALQNLWLGHGINASVPLWLAGAVRSVDGDYDVNLDALVDALNNQTDEYLRSQDSDVLRQARSLLTTHLMLDNGNVEILFKLAKVEAALGNYSSAMTYLKKAAAGGFNDTNALESKDLNCLHGQNAWSDVVSTVRHNKGPVKKSTLPKNEKIKFQFGKCPEGDDSKSAKKDSSATPSKAAAPKPKEEEKPAPKPAAGGFLFALPGAQPEKPKEEPKPAPAAGGFLFALPGAAPAAKQPEPAKVEAKKEEKPEPPPEVKKFQAQLDALHGMGFLDDSLLIGFLEKNKGNVDDVLNELLG